MLTLFSALIQVNEDLKTIGALAGLLAVPGLAVLSLLYFGQAREVRRLREWAGRAPERAAELEQRVTAEAQRRSQVGAPTTPAAQAATGTTAAPATGGNGVAKSPPGAPATVAAQAATATEGEKKGEEDKKAEGDEAAKPGEAAAEKKTEGEAKKEDGEKKAGEEDKKEPVATPAAAAGPPTTASPAATPAGAGAAAAATAAARARTAAPPVPPRPAQPARASVPSATIPPRNRPPVSGGASGAGSPLSRVSRGGLIGVGAAVLVLAITVAIVLKVTGGDDNSPTPAPNTVAGSSAGQPAAGAKPAAPAVSKAQRAQTSVAVLNGTTVTGLARSVASRLQDQGYTVGNVTDGPNQAQPQTKVEYGSGHRDEARALATVIKVPPARVIALSPDDSTTAGPSAEVVVVVGQDSAR